MRGTERNDEHKGINYLVKWAHWNCYRHWWYRCMDHGTLRERDRLFVRRAFLVDFGMVDGGMLSVSAYSCPQGGIRWFLLSVFVTQFWTLMALYGGSYLQEHPLILRMTGRPSNLSFLNSVSARTRIIRSELSVVQITASWWVTSCCHLRREISLADHLLAPPLLCSLLLS